MGINSTRDCYARRPSLRKRKEGILFPSHPKGKAAGPAKRRPGKSIYTLILYDFNNKLNGHK